MTPTARTAVSALAAELGKFGVIGAVAFVVDVGLFNLLRSGALESAPLTAKVVSMGTATLVAWAGNRWWTFRSGRTGQPGQPGHVSHRRALLPELALFVSTNGVALVISLVCLGLSHYVLGLRSAVADNISANVVGVALGTAFRFYAYRTWVFRRTRAVRRLADVATGAAGERLPLPRPGGAAQDGVAVATPRAS